MRIRGRVIVGDNCFVDEDAELEDSVVWSEASVQRGASIKDSVIGRNCVVKNGSRHVAKATVAPKVLI